MGNFFVDIEKGKKYLGIDSDNIKGCIEEYNTGNYEGIFGNYGFGFKEDNFDFLHELTNVKSIWFWEVNLKNTEGIYTLDSLGSFGLHGKRNGINFAKFPNLKVLSTDWISSDENLENCLNIHGFYLWHHKPKEKNFEKYHFPPCSNEIQLNWSNVSDLNTLNGLKGIKRFEIHRSRNLVSLKGLEKYQDTLEEVIVDTCGRLSDYKFLGKFPKLKFVSINGNVVINKND